MTDNATPEQATNPAPCASPSLTALGGRVEIDRNQAARQIEEIISAWAFAHDIDGAARNDLFKRLATSIRGPNDR